VSAHAQLLLALACALLLATCAPLGLAERIDQNVQSYVTDKKFMGSVLVARGDNVLLDKGYGFADVEWEIANSPATKFRLASITKQFTAASVLLLEERGQLNIDDPINKYLPNAPPAWAKITIFNLLTHTSGIQNFTAFPDYRATEATPTIPDQLVARFRDKPLNFPPGERMEYSNSGYVVLGTIIEATSGLSYKDFVQQNIFTPLNMSDSGYDSNLAVIPRRAAGYSATGYGFVNAPYIDMSIPYSAGGLYSTTRDLLRWEQALFGGKVISAGSLARMTTPFKDDYALGVQMQTIGGH
jgi:CubicO group peptidase (beta-lactamase class C family)